MKRALAAKALLFGALLTTSTAALAQEPPRCQMQQIAAIPVAFEHNRAYVKVSIGGREVRMLADTGSDRSLMYVDAARSLGLNPVYEGGEFHGVGGNRGVMRVTAPKFRLGDSAPADVPFLAIERRKGGGEAVVGILGLDFFGQAETEFDLANGFIRLFHAVGCEHNNLAYWTKEPMVADMHPGGIGVGSFDLPLKLNGHTVDATLDSGAQTSVVVTEAALRAGGKVNSEKVEGYSQGLGSETVAIQTVVFDSLAVGDEEVKNVKLKVGDLFRAGAETSTGSHIALTDGPEMLLGADFLHAHRVMVSRSQHRMYFTYVGGPVFQVVTSAEKPKP